jgi:hypothetical protein
MIRELQEKYYRHANPRYVVLSPYSWQQLRKESTPMLHVRYDLGSTPEFMGLPICVLALSGAIDDVELYEVVG